MPMSALVETRHLNEDQAEVAEIIGIDSYRKLIDAFGGSQIWIPKARSLVPGTEIAGEVRCRRLAGESYEHIARELELSIADVRKMSK